MYKLFKIAKDNMKKQKSDMITFFILTFIAAFLIFDSTSAILGFGNVLDDCFKDINGAHVMLYSADTDAEKDAAEKAFTEDDRIIDYEQSPLIEIIAKYKKPSDEEYMDYQFLAESFDVEKTLMDVKKPDIDYKKNDILLPFNMHNSYAVGDVIQLKLDDDVYNFDVVGYIEDPYFCSTMNITMYSVCMSQEMIDELKEDHSNLALAFIAHKGTVDEKALENREYGTKDVENDIGKVYKEEIAEAAKENPEANYNNYMLINWQMMRGGSQFIPMVVIAIILMFAILIFIIAIVIISFSVKNFIQKNMKNTGILEASGYTVRELRAALTLQIMFIGFIGSIIGVVVGILTFGSFGNIIASVLGLTWNQPVNMVYALLTVIVVVAVLGLVARLISRAYKKITVLDALRGGISTHNFKKNFFSFEKTPLPISLVMALKETFGGLGRNILMVFVAALLSISVLIGFGLLENFGKDTNTIVSMFGFEMATAIVQDDDYNTDYEKIVEDISEVDGVKNVMTLTGIEPTVIHEDKESTIYTYAVDDIEKTQNTIVIEGRIAENDNEIMLTSGAAEDLDAKIGDVVTIKYANDEADYIVVGINQRVERMGRTVLMTIDGAKRVVPGAMAYQYYVQAEEGVSFDKLTDNLDTLEKDEDYSFSYVDEEKMMTSTVESVTTAMKLICIIISAITILVVIFVESLVIRAKINREWKGMGISKALGQTSGNLITQIMLSNMPALLVGTVLGALVAPAAGSSFCKTAFSLFSIQNVPFDIPVYYLLITVIGIVAVAILTSGSAGLKVRGLKPVEMITEE